MRILLVKVALQEQNALLRRIAEALERLSPTIPALPPPRKADLSDLRVVDHEGQRVLAEVQEEFARVTETVPGSEAFQRAMKAFEDELRMWKGQEAVDELPWNSIGKRS